MTNITHPSRPVPHAINKLSECWDLAYSNKEEYQDKYIPVRKIKLIEQSARHGANNVLL